jgi:hypothetical protein
MATAQHASCGDWLRVYGGVYEALPERLDLECPNRGHKTFRLEFAARASDRIGYAMLV